MANLNQTHILNQFKKYLEIQYKKKGKSVYQFDEIKELLTPYDTGHCSGLAGLYLHYKGEEQESIFFGNLNLISEWDGTDESLQKSPFLEDTFEKVINDVTFMQREYDLMAYNVRHQDLPDILEIVKPTQKKTPLKSQLNKEKAPVKSQLRKEFEMNYVFDDKELQFTLEHTLKDRKMMRLTSSNHAIAIMLIDGKYHLYDPNERQYNENLKSNEIVVDSIEELIPYIRKDLFENFCEKDKHIDFKYMPIEIQNFAKNNQPESNYRYSPEDLMLKFSSESENNIYDDYRKNNYDNLDPMAFALHLGNVRTVNFLIKQGETIPETYLGKEIETVVTSINEGKVSTTIKKERKVHIPILNAIFDNNFNLLRIIVDNNPNVLEKTGEEALVLAMKKGHYDIASYLLDKGVKLNKQKVEEIYTAQVNNFFKKGYKHKAFDIQLLKMFEKANFRIEHVNDHFMLHPSPMEAAIRTGDLEVIKYLHSKGVTLRREHYRSALKSNHVAVVSYMIKEKFNDLEMDMGSASYSETPISTAVEAKALNVVQFLIKEGANVNAESLFRGVKINDILLNAVKSGNLAMTKLLIDSGADVNANLKSRGFVFSPFGVAMRLGNITMMQYLLQRGVDPKAIDGGNNLLTFVLDMINLGFFRLDVNSIVEIMQMLIKAEADVNHMSDDGTALHMALKLEMEPETADSIVKLLLENGARLNIKNEDGQTVIDKIVNRKVLNLSSNTIKLIQQYYTLENKINVESENTEVAEEYANNIKKLEYFYVQAAKEEEERLEALEAKKTAELKAKQELAEAQAELKAALDEKRKAEEEISLWRNQAIKNTLTDMIKLGKYEVANNIIKHHKEAIPNLVSDAADAVYDYFLDELIYDDQNQEIFDVKRLKFLHENHLDLTSLINGTPMEKAIAAKMQKSLKFYLLNAMYHQKDELVKSLIPLADLNADETTSSFKELPLAMAINYAADGGELELVQSLLKAGASPNVIIDQHSLLTNFVNWITNMSFGCTPRVMTVAEFLVKSGLNINYVSKDGTALDIISKANDKSKDLSPLIKLLKDHGARLNNLESKIYESRMPPQSHMIEEMGPDKILHVQRSNHSSAINPSASKLSGNQHSTEQKPIHLLIQQFCQENQNLRKTYDHLFEEVRQEKMKGKRVPNVNSVKPLVRNFMAEQSIANARQQEILPLEFAFKKLSVAPNIENMQAVKDEVTKIRQDIARLKPEYLLAGKISLDRLCEKIERDIEAIEKSLPIKPKREI